MTYTVTGLVLRETEVKENDKFITLLTPELGKISVYCHGARSVKSRNLAPTQLFAYGEYVVSEKGESYTLREAALYDSFYNIRNSFERLALGQYVLAALLEITSEGDSERDMLRLALNTVYALAYTEKPSELIKAAFEMRAVSDEGFMPDLDGCGHCGGEAGEGTYLDILGGHLICRECMTEQVRARIEAGAQIIPVDTGALDAMRYAISAPLERIFSFTLEDEAAEAFRAVSERYFIAHIERSFASLEFYNSLMGYPKPYMFRTN